LILEPTPHTADSFDAPTAGVLLAADGDDFRTFRITDLTVDGAARVAGMQVEDVIVSLDGRPAATMTLDELLRRFEQPSPCAVIVMRGSAQVTMTFTPRPTFAPLV
jgi:C-terminal processing protease CtpA/Prc